MGEGVRVSVFVWGTRQAEKREGGRERESPTQDAERWSLPLPLTGTPDDLAAWSMS